MPRRKGLIAPKLFTRGSSNVLWFRQRIDGKDKWISTGASNREDALKVAMASIKAKTHTASSFDPEESAERIAKSITGSLVREITGKSQQAHSLDSLHDEWVLRSNTYKDLSRTSQVSRKSVLRDFAAWCKDEGLQNAEDVTPDIALKYAKHLWESRLTAKSYNDRLQHLSRVFSTLDLAFSLPYRDPFDKRRVPRKSKAELKPASHLALEPQTVKALIQEAANVSLDCRDLFIVGSQTGMRMADAVLLKWSYIDGDFLEFIPVKTRRSKNTARIPISNAVREILESRCGLRSTNNPYVFPELAKQYEQIPQAVIAKTKRVFERVLGKENTVVKAKDEAHRKKNTSICSFHSFRTTFMSLLASQDVSIRDAMRIMGWESMEMIRVYERELEKARKDTDARALKLINRIEEFHLDFESFPAKKPRLLPTKEALRRLTQKYSNAAIGKMYEISETAVRNWQDKFGIERTKRIESPELSEMELAKIREDLKAQAT